jgi:hypothetical protein
MGKLEEHARAALRRAKAAAEPLDPDRWGRDDGESFGYVSAGRVAEAEQTLLRPEGLDVELLEAAAVGGVIKTRWTWGTDRWRSEPRTIDVPTTSKRGGPLSISAAVSLGRKVFVRQLLELRTAEDHEANLARSMDSARELAFEAIADALRDFCRRNGKSEDLVLRSVTGVDPGPGVEATVAHLHPWALAELWKYLLYAAGGASRQFDPGAGVEGMDELPEGL